MFLYLSNKGKPLKQEKTNQGLEREFDKWWDSHCRKVGGIVERGLAYQDTKAFYLNSLKEFAEEIRLEKIRPEIEEQLTQREKNIYHNLKDLVDAKIDSLLTPPNSKEVKK